MTSQIGSPSRSKTLRVAFIVTTVSGVAYYRMASFAWSMRTWPKVETVVWPYSKNVTIQNPWQLDIMDSSDLRKHIDYLCEMADIVVWQTLDFKHSFEFWMDLRTRHQKPFIMEIDDFVSDIPVENEAYEQFKTGSIRHRVAMDQMRQSDAVIVSTPYLKKQYEGMNDHIYVIPNSIEFSEWDSAHRRKGGDRLRIGWIGGGTHSSDLEMIQPVLSELLSENDNVWFYCIHGVPNSYKKMRHVYWTHKWSKINLYPKFMASFKFDIGVAPLVDNNFNRGKSNLRWLEYSALKVPCVASPLPDFTRSIDHGETGFLANDLLEWKKCLSDLIQVPELRDRVGVNAYKKVRDQFNVRKTSTNYMRLLRRISDGEFLSADQI